MRSIAIVAIALSGVALAGSVKHTLMRADLAVLGVEPGSTTTLANVIRKFGYAALSHTGDASESEHKVCYALTSKNDSSYVIFASSGEMASPKGQVNSIRLLTSSEAGIQERQCPRLRSPGSPRVANGLTLGMTPAQVQALLGEGPPGASGELEYAQCKQVPFAKGTEGYRVWFGRAGCFPNPSEPIFDDCLSIRVKFLEGKASAIQVSGIQSVC